MLTSNRNIPLIYQGTSRVPTITVENYSKWYDLYVVYPDGTVQAIDYYNSVEPNVESNGESSILDHTFNPLYVKRIAKFFNYQIDHVSLETIIGRWILEYRNEFDSDD